MVILSFFTKAFIIGFTGAMAPGPLLTQTISRSARRGFITAPLIILGHGILELMLIVGLIFGISKFLTNQMVSGTIGVAGGIVLVWLGYDIIKSTLQGKFSLSSELALHQDEEEDDQISQHAGTVLAGFFVTGSNPYFFLWWATVGLALFNESIKLMGSGGPLVFFSGHIVADLIWYILIGLAVVKGKDFIPEKVYRGVLLFCGLFLIGFAIKFIVFGLASLI